MNTKSITTSSTTWGYIPTNYVTYTSVISTGDITPKKTAYKCAYCGIIYEHKTGICDGCGAPLSEAEEVEE